jgi:integration host factor subunit beta
MPVTKSDLIENLSERLKLPKGKAEFVVNTIFESMEAALRDGDRIEIRGFGSFVVKHREARDGRNPRTGKRVAVAAKRVPFFKVGKELRLRVDGDAQAADTAAAQR